MRDTRNENATWRFHAGDVEGAAAPEFDDRHWRCVDLPHDYMIEGAFDPDAPAGRTNGFLHGGIGWYRKALEVDPSWRGRRVHLDFDGVMANGRAFVNGAEVARRPNGYVGFRVDVTERLDFGGRNVVAVRTDTAEQPASRWYTGSGIYRDVHLVVTGERFIPRGGTFVRTRELADEAAIIAVTTEVAGASDANGEVTVRITVSRNGKPVAESSCPVTLGGAPGAAAEQELRIDRPARWSPDEPQLYELACAVVEGERIVDEHRETFGIRSAEFDRERGFLLNGVPTKLKGVCLHHDLGPLGAKCFRAAIERRLRLLQQMGCNAIRCAHNGYSRHFYDLCDRLGLLVIDELFDEWREAKQPFAYHRYFDAWWQRDLADQLRDNRNHPCVIAWSIGNEIPERSRPEGAKLARMLREACRRVDPTRPVTAGCNNIDQANASGFADELDVVGINGGGGSCFRYDENYRDHPGRRLYASEVPHTFATRGIYKTHTQYRDKTLHPERFARMQVIDVPNLTERELFTGVHPAYYSSYDNALVRINVRDSWRLVAEREFMAGEFRWTGVDYLGESHQWPAKGSNAGVIDLCGFPKDPYFLYQSLWTDAPRLHLLPHWTHPGREGARIPVWAYTNCDAVELFLGVQSLGLKRRGDAYHLAWDVPYEPGVLRAKAWRDDRLAAEDAVRTAGDACRVTLEPDRSEMPADRAAVAHVAARIEDAEGALHPLADQLLRFRVDGPGEIIGVGNGDPVSDEPAVATRRRAFGGMAVCVVRSTGGAGTITVTAESEGLEAGTARIAGR